MTDGQRSTRTTLQICALVSADSDEDVVNLCNTLNLSYGQAQPVGCPQDSKTSAINYSEVPLALAALSAPPPAALQKKLLVQRMASCDGPLACHALQRCLQQHISTSGIVTRPDRALTELREWFTPVLDTIIDCCGPVPGNEQLTANRKLQCATFLLQVCSTTLKSERGASHPERADQPCTVISSSTPTPTSPNIGCPNTSCVREDGSSTSSTGSINRLAARTCAELALAYLSKMLVAASELMGAEFAAGKTDDAWTKGRHSGKDAVFWVLSFVSDVLKHFSKQQWIFPGASSSEAQKHATDALRTPTEVTSAVTVTTTANSESAARDISIYVNKTSSDKFDVEGLAGVVADVPVQYACGMEDVALKWLEVIQLLMDSAEETSPSLLSRLFASVPPILWRMTDHARLFMPRDEPSRPPGSAFVEEDGADGALFQAILRLLFRMVRLQSEQGFLHPHVELESDSCVWEANNAVAKEGGKGGGIFGAEHEKTKTAPWCTAVEMLSVICAANCAGNGLGDSCVEFGARLLRVFFEQDDALVDMLLTNLHIYHNIRTQAAALGADEQGSRSAGQCQQLWGLYRRHFHPAALFSALVSEVGFDCRVLLDWLISPETSFLPYLTLLLRLAVAEWSEFAAYLSGASPPLAGSGCSAPAAPLANPEDEEELVLSEEEAKRLGRVVACLSGLTASARGLANNGLLPYNLAPLLNRIGQVIELYEECGDAEDGDMSEENEDAFCSSPRGSAESDSARIDLEAEVR